MNFFSEGCNKNVAVALISMHNCSLDAKIRVNLGKIYLFPFPDLSVYYR